jgi:CDP-glucose 4,6-dehydratase
MKTSTYMKENYEDVYDLGNERFWRGRNVLVTGATGFVGSWITEALVNMGANVVILVRDVSSLSSLALKSASSIHSRARAAVLGDVTVYSVIERILNEYEVDTCFHLASQTIVGVAKRSPLSTFKSNIMGTWNVLEACRRSRILQRVVVASSDKAYGEPLKLPITEDHPLLAAYPYDASKACADILARTYFETYGLPVGVTRCSNIYGGGDMNFSRIIPDTVRSVLIGKAPIIRSDGTPERDYMYISDAVNAYITLAENLDRPKVKGEAFNFGTGKPVSVLDLVEKIINLAGKPHLKPVILGRETKEIKVQYLSTKKAKDALNWEARVSLEQGLVKTIKWYKENMQFWMPLGGV